LAASTPVLVGVELDVEVLVLLELSAQVGRIEVAVVGRNLQLLVHPVDNVKTFFFLRHLRITQS